MAKRQEKIARKLKKSHAWIACIIYFVVMLVAGAVIFTLLSQLGYYIAQSKLSSEYEIIRYMAKTYERQSESGTPEMEADGPNAEREFFVRDKASQKILYGDGENSCGDEGGEVLLTSVSEKVQLYQDVNNGYISASGYGTVSVDKKGVWQELKRLKETNKETFQKVEKSDGEYVDEDGVLKIGKTMTVRLPVWMAVEIKDGSEEFVGKAHLEINLADMTVFAVCVGILALLAFLFFIVMLVSAIRGVVSQRKMFTMFFTDMATAGHNWMWFLFRGEHFLRKRSSAKYDFAVINLEFVNYRNYCVCHSIEAGEKMLKKVYALLASHCEKKEMVAHVSNSDFALLLRCEDMDSLEIRIREILNKLEQIDTDHRFSFQVGISSIGIQKNENDKIVRRKNIDLELEYNNACTARETLSDNDESGIAVFDEKLVEEQKWIDLVTERQKTALEQEEFLVYYQPKYDPGTDQLRGAEALIRWQSDEMGFVPPGKFIPIFEKNGFITEIDHYMLEHVARDQKAWLDQGRQCVPVSVNISRAHFIESDLAEQIRDIVDQVGTPHEYIELELTESAFFDDKKALVTTITKLKEYGFSVSMDDFGSGYSSLNSLKDLPLDVLKLDAEFFRGDTKGKRGELVVSEAIKLAKSLNMRTVAEGVEEKEQVEFLAEQGCDMIQGYYYAKPMPKEEYEQRING